MGNLFRSWFFFTALLVFLLTCAAAAPDLGQRLFGQTGQRMMETADHMETQVRQVWAELKP